NRFSEAARVYREVLALQPEEAKALHLLGVVEAQLGHRDVAIQLIAKAVEADPADATAHYNLGNVLRELGCFEDALAAYDRSLALPSAPAVVNNRGAVLFELGRVDEALSAYDRALAIDPKRAEALCNRGKALLTLGKFQDALSSYNQSLALRS